MPKGMQIPLSDDRSPARRRLVTRAAAVATAAALALPSTPVPAEKADRSKPMIVEADKPGTLDTQRQIVVFNGNVSFSQGTLLIRAERMEVRELPSGWRAATAIGTPTRQASYRQKRDAPDESVEGYADRIEFDGSKDTVRFIGNALVRRLRSSTVADEITGSLIAWDNTNELFTVQGGAATPANPGGRVRVVISPRPEDAPAPGAAASGPPLKPAIGLSDTAPASAPARRDPR